MTMIQRAFARTLERCRAPARIALADGPRGRGLFADEPLKKGDMLLEVPRDAWYPLSAARARADAPASLVDAADGVRRPRDSFTLPSRWRAARF